ncbi:hypothetical protein KR009_006034 [Drosophila setifemur]|nr:hypothetical protein KR009_006034 [Drosophila setifemur]
MESPKKASTNVPLESWSKITRIIRVCVKILGCDVTSPNFRMWWLTYSVIGAIFFFFACTGYTIYVGVYVNGDLTAILQALTMVGSGVQGLTKLLCTASHSPLMCLIRNTYEDIYREYGEKGGGYTKCLERSIKSTWNIIYAFLAIYFLAMGLLISFPIFYLLIFKKKLMMLLFLVPLIDHTTDRGLVLLSVVHAFLILVGGFGNFGGDMYLFLFVTHVPLIKDIFCVKLEELNELLTMENKQQEVSAILSDLVALHQKYAKWVGKSIYLKSLTILFLIILFSMLRGTEKIFSMILFAQLLTACLSILATISCIFMKAWPAAPIYLGYSAIVLYSYCGLGTLVENSNDSFTREIYTGPLWYELPVNEEKMIILMLAKAQSELSLTAAHMMPLSMNTALHLTKAIYSYSMILFNYLN